MRRRTFVAGAVGLVGAAGCRGPKRSPAPPAAADASEGFEHLRGMLDDVAPPDVAEHAAHVESVREQLRVRELGAVVVEPGPAMTYLSGVEWGRSERPFLLVIPIEGAPVWVVPAFELRTAREC